MCDMPGPASPSLGLQLTLAPPSPQGSVTHHAVHDTLLLGFFTEPAGKGVGLGGSSTSFILLRWAVCGLPIWHTVEAAATQLPI